MLLSLSFPFFLGRLFILNKQTNKISIPNNQTNTQNLLHLHLLHEYGHGHGHGHGHEHRYDDTMIFDIGSRELWSV